MNVEFTEAIAEIRAEKAAEMHRCQERMARDKGRYESLAGQVYALDVALDALKTPAPVQPELSLA